VVVGRAGTWWSRKGRGKLTSDRVEFPCGSITLEGVWHLPPGKGPFPAVVVCHPHSLYGGNMWNNVVIAACESLSGESIAAFRFNFRGVGNSGGTFGGGAAEREDVKAALSLVSSTENIDPERIGLVGYSFGGSVALQVALEDEHVGLLALVSPALTDSAWDRLEEFSRPKLVVVGDADTVVRLDLFRQHLKSTRAPAQYQFVSGADHFWLGYEEELSRKLADFFVAGFKTG
jgi:alpha/beta superfamily hydrolase